MPRRRWSAARRVAQPVVRRGMSAREVLAESSDAFAPALHGDTTGSIPVEAALERRRLTAAGRRARRGRD